MKIGAKGFQPAFVAYQIGFVAAHYHHPASRLAGLGLSAEEIDSYIASGEWDGKAGGYAIQGIAEGLISRIQGSHSGVVGLPLYETRTLLKSAGFDIA